MLILKFIFCYIPSFLCVGLQWKKIYSGWEDGWVSRCIVFSGHYEITF